MTRVTADEIRSALRLPNNEAGRAAAEALVENDAEDEPLGYLSDRELAPDSNFRRALRGLSQADQANVLSPLVNGLRSPVNIPGKGQLRVSAMPGVDLSTELQVARAPVPPPQQVYDPVGRAVEVSQQVAGVKMRTIGGTALVGTGLLTATGGAVAVGFGVISAPVWVPVAAGAALIAAGVALIFW